MDNYAIIQNYAILCDFMKIMQYRIDRVKSSSLVWSQESEVWSQESGVWSQEYGVWSQECGMRSEE